MKKILLTALVAVFAVTGFNAFTAGQQESGELLIIASDCTWPPMEFITADNEIAGFDIDFIEAVAEEGGFRVEIRNTAWDDIFTALEEGECDAVISSVTITEERKKTMDFSTPYINVSQVLIVSSGSEAKTLTDLEGKDVGAQIGTTGAFVIESSAASLKTYNEIGPAMEDLTHGRIAGVVADTPTASDYVLRNDDYRGRIKIVGDALTDEHYGIAVKKGRPELLALINGGIEFVRNKGIYEELENKWLR